jgi:urease alpha subunit
VITATTTIGQQLAGEIVTIGRSLYPDVAERVDRAFGTVGVALARLVEAGHVVDVTESGVASMRAAVHHLHQEVGEHALGAGCLLCGPAGQLDVDVAGTRMAPDLISTELERYEGRLESIHIIAMRKGLSEWEVVEVYVHGDVSGPETVWTAWSTAAIAQRVQCAVDRGFAVV